MLFAFVPKPKEPIDLNRPLRVTLTILALLVFISWPLLLIAAFNKVEINIPGMNLPSSTVTVICALIVAPPVLGTFLVWLLRKDRIKQK